MTRKQLINYYEKKLEKVKDAYSNDCRKEDYIKFAEKELEEVKNGRTW